MRAQIAARLTPSFCDKSVPGNRHPAARSAERICASVVIFGLEFKRQLVRGH